MKRCAPFLMGFAVLALSGCGALMDLRDALGPTKYGPLTPHGQIKRDFWGNTYIEPYPHLLRPPEPIRDEQDGDGSPKQ
jgi:hypothetical protein